MDSKRIKIGVIGCASIAERSVIPALVDMPDQSTLCGVASRNELKAEKFAKKFNTKPFKTYDCLMESGQVEALYIPLPNALHYVWIEKALKNDLHVIVEKSLACSYKENIALNKLAQRRKLVLVENFQFRFHKQLEAINQILKDGLIGELRYLRSSFGFPPFSDPLNIRYQASLGGGALLDAGAYPIRIAQYFLGENLKVAAANLIYSPEREIDLWGGAYLKQKSGHIFAEIAFGFDFHYQCNLELLGNKGLISANRIFTAPPGHSVEIALETAEGKVKKVIPPDNHFINMLTHFYNLVISGRNVENEYNINVNQARIIEDLRHKANESQ